VVNSLGVQVLHSPILAALLHRYSSSGCQPNFAVFSGRRHLYSAGRPSRWASAHILVHFCLASAFCQLIMKSVCYVMLFYLQDHSVCQFCREKSCFVMFILLQKTILCEFSLAWPFSGGGGHLRSRKLMRVSTPSGYGK